MADGYSMSKTLEYSTEYMQRFEGTSRLMRDDKEEPQMNDEIMVQSGGWMRPMSKESMIWAHDFVLSMQFVGLGAVERSELRALHEVGEWREAFQSQSSKEVWVTCGCPLPVGMPFIPEVFGMVLRRNGEDPRGSTQGSMAWDKCARSTFPEPVATAYSAKYAHSMHWRVRSAEEETVNCDSPIASLVLRFAYMVESIR